MLPIRLILRNFMSYGEPEEELDFRPLRLACISGNNGEGKSALLDALTWVLWGVARGTDVGGRGADDLIRIGADDMRVSLEFEVYGELWRVERTRRRGRGGNLVLAHFADGEWQNASAATITLTQEVIKSLVGLDYQTFVNSAFLLQGRADEFSRQNAGERKKILGDILGLGVFDDLAERARGQAREAQAKSDLLEMEITRLEEELAREDELKEQAKHLETQLIAGRQELTAARQAQKDQEAMLARLEDAQHRRKELAERVKKADEHAAALEKELARLRAHLAQSAQLLARAGEINTGYASLAAARTAEQDWGKRAAEHAMLVERRAPHLAALEGARAALQAKVANLESQVANLEFQIEDKSAEKNLGDVKAAIAALEARQPELEAAQQALKEAEAERTRQEEVNRQLQVQITEKQECIELLSHAGAMCPVCKTKLTDQGRRELLDTSKAELVELRKSLNDYTKYIVKAKAQEREYAERVKQIEKALAGLAALRQKLGQYESAQAQAQQAREQMAGAQQNLTLAQAELKQEQFAPEARQLLAAVAADIKALSYDAAAHRESVAKVRELAGFEAEKLKLDGAHASTKAYRESVEKTVASQQTACAEAQALRNEIDKLQQELADLPQLRAQSKLLAENLTKIEKQVGETEQQVAVIQNNLAQLQEARKNLQTCQKEKNRAREDAVVHLELATAFGKNGVQALIIETALPQLERHANELLEKLTEGRMRVGFYTQRARAGGEMTETLEIRIRDDSLSLGAGESSERRYEMFSGGEAFRLNFAIRLALSRLLAQRAGAQLSTLVIDEGFGSQDAAGRQRLVEAIRAVADDFRLILVITHLDELKGEFSERVEISKDELGSHIRSISI
jgi:DNA repair protein SbcC/Rad50